MQHESFPEELLQQGEKAATILISKIFKKQMLLRLSITRDERGGAAILVSQS